MRLLLAIAEMAIGGAEAVVCELARGALERGEQVAVAAAPGPLDRRLDALRVERIVTHSRSRSPAAMARTGLTASRALRRFQPDLVHVHNPRMTGILSVAARVRLTRRPPVVATHHGVPPEETRAAARIMRMADHVVGVSRTVADDLASAGVPGKRLTVIPNGVPAIPAPSAERRAELDAELGLERAIVVSAVGRLVPQKAHDRFLSAAAIVARADPRVQFLVVGEGPLRRSLEQRALRLGIARRVRFTGVRPDARDLIARSDLLVFSSDWEGLPLVALEGLAAGIAMLSTEVAGMDELAAARAATLVTPEPEALATGMVELIADPQRRIEMGRRGRLLHERRFSVARMIDSYRDLYEIALQNARTSSTLVRDDHARRAV